MSVILLRICCQPEKCLLTSSTLLSSSSYSHTQNISRNFQMNKFVNFTLKCSSDLLKINMFNPISEGEGSIIPPMENRF